MVLESSAYNSVTAFRDNPTSGYTILLSLKGYHMQGNPVHNAIVYLSSQWNRVWLPAFGSPCTLICIKHFKTFLVIASLILLSSRELFMGNNIIIVTVAVSCGWDTCFAVETCDELYHFMFTIDRVGIPFGFQTIKFTLARHPVSRCL